MSTPRRCSTSNQGFERWGEILHDEGMAAALLDPLRHRCHIVDICDNGLLDAPPRRTLQGDPLDGRPSPVKPKRIGDRGSA